MAKILTAKKIAIFCGAVVLAVIFWFVQQKTQVNDFYTRTAFHAHHALNTNVSLKKINIKAVYFVPAEASNNFLEEWRENLQGALQKTADFYSSQFNQSVITFEIYPQVVIGKNESGVYDGSNTNGGNPNALLTIRGELAERLFSPSGDLYLRGFGDVDPESFAVLGILYQGVGSGGTVFKPEAGFVPGLLPAFFVSADYLSKDEYSEYGDTFFAHEFAHTLGLKDNYNLETGQPYGDDLMGAGRFRPLIYTFISEEDKKAFGIKP